MTTLLPRLAAIPELRAAAEAEARCLFDAMCMGGGPDNGWDSLPAWVRESRVAAHLSRLLDPLNPAAEGVLADLYRRVTGRRTAYAVPYDDGSVWHIAYPSPDTGDTLVAVLHESPTRYEAWARALVAHYDVLAAREDGTGF